eukprot:Opistho-2@47561
MAEHGKGVAIPAHDGSALRIGIVRARWNPEVINALHDGCIQALKSCGVRDENIIVESVPGSYELPYGAAALAASGRVDAVVTLGCLIKGETMHFEYICEAVTQGIMRINLDTKVPVMFGVLCCMTMDQARARAGLTESGHNHGTDWGLGAVEMALIRQRYHGNH